MTKQEHIEEIAKLIKSVKLYSDDNYERKISYDSALELAKYFYNAEYRKIPKDTVLLTKEECEHKVILDEDHFERALNYERENVRKKTAKEILDGIFAQYNEIGGGLYELTPRDKKMLYKKYEVETENAELQKQVDKAKEQFLLTCENCHFKKDIELLQYQKEQAIKEFAEKIKEKYGHYWCYLYKKELKQLHTIIDELLKEYKE